MSVVEQALLSLKKQSQEISFWMILGPIFLLCSVALSGSWDLLFLALVGLYLAARFGRKGCVYAFVCLAIVSLLRHTWFSWGDTAVPSHLWNLGLEASIGCAFLITSLGFQYGAAFIESLASQIDEREVSLKKLEFEREKERQERVSEGGAMTDKIASLQKGLEDLQSDHSSLLILNDVLRRKAARVVEEKDGLAEISLDQQRKIGSLTENLDAARKELKRISNTEAQVIENKALQKELNALRVGKEQTHLINETLARLHAKECMKNQESVHLWNQERAKFQEQIQYLKGEAEMLNGRLEQMALEKENGRIAQLEWREIQMERNLLRERLSNAEEELRIARQKREDTAELCSLHQRIVSLEAELAQRTNPEEVDQWKEQVRAADEKIKTLSQIEPLFRQLKKQFEEKNEILHQTRSELFKADTELQTIRIEREQRQLQQNPLTEELREELALLDAQVQALEEENQELQELITILSGQPSRKKKVKTTSADVQLLF